MSALPIWDGFVLDIVMQAKLRLAISLSSCAFNSWRRGLSDVFGLPMVRWIEATGMGIPRYIIGMLLSGWISRLEA